MAETPPYCLDANVLIQAWREYYSPVICPTYWDVLNEMGINGSIFLPGMVYEEITRTDDELSIWLKKSAIKVHKQDGSIAEIVRRIFAAHPSHPYLVDNQKNRSIADPWVIAHAIAAEACVVTKEKLVLAAGPGKVKIPNVCQNMGVRCINDFEFTKEIGLRFTCEFPWSAK